MYFQVREMANQIEDKHFVKTTINVRGKKKTYYTFEKNVVIDHIGEVKLVISKRKKDRINKIYHKHREIAFFERSHIHL